MEQKTHFGFEKVAREEKSKRVGAVFDSVASRYDRMNDLMSFGLHRLWKAQAVALTQVRRGHRVLDLASGTGDLALALAKKAGRTGSVWMTDINRTMLDLGRERALDAGWVLPTLQCSAEQLPFASNEFDRVTVAFGLRNMTDKGAALAEMRRVVRPGGRVCILEFSKIWQPLATTYNRYLMGILPWLGQRVAGDANSYRYLAESIQMHPDQAALAGMMRAAGFDEATYYNFAAGAVALHIGLKF